MPVQKGMPGMPDAQMLVLNNSCYYHAHSDEDILDSLYQIFYLYIDLCFACMVIIMLYCLLHNRLRIMIYI